MVLFQTPAHHRLSFMGFMKIENQSILNFWIQKQISLIIEKLELDLMANSFGEYGNFYIGRSPCNIGDDETGKQFKDSVKESLLKLFNKEFVEKNIGFHDDSEYNG